MTVFWIGAPCILVDSDRRLRGFLLLHNESRDWKQVRFSETSVSVYQTTRCNFLSSRLSRWQWGIWQGPVGWQTGHLQRGWRCLVAWHVTSCGAVARVNVTSCSSGSTAGEPAVCCHVKTEASWNTGPPTPFSCFPSSFCPIFSFFNSFFS
jgi:hypothetical protein